MVEEVREGVSVVVTAIKEKEDKWSKDREAENTAKQ